MIKFEEYFKYLKQREKISFHFNRQFEQLANNSKYLRSNKVIKKYQKDLEKQRATSLNVVNDIFKDEQKKKGVIAVVKVDQEKDSKLKLFFKKLFGIKPPVIAGIIEEFSETTDTSVKAEVDSEAYVIETEDIEEEFDDEDFDDDFEDDWEEETEDFFDDDRIKGQMDIEDLN